MNNDPPIAALFIMLGLFFGALALGSKIYHSRIDANYVTVKGLAERDVTADLAVWNLNYSATGDDLVQVNNEITHDQNLTLAFLKRNNIPANEIEIEPTKVTDMFANPYQTAKPLHRFLIKGAIKIRSNQVAHIQRVSQMTGALIQQGIALGNINDDPNSVNPVYFYTQLNSIRPAMLAEATKSARQVAEQFALDSGSQLGMIHSANQGVFEITSQDAAGITAPGSDWQNAQSEKASIKKKVRLVTTIQYTLTEK